ncbi:hypothetical protein AABB24_006445, partial [Solanum stoloniferum]
QIKIMKGCINILGLTLFLIQIIIINSKKSSLSLRSDKDEQMCGFESCYEKCPTGQCCSWLGYCGTTFKYCGYKYCKSQCPSPPSPPPPSPPPSGRCGVQAGGIKCPDGSCCGEEGWCGTTEYYCNPQWCQSQCKIPYLSTENRTIDDYECGRQGCYKKCPSGSCCSIWGYCGTTKDHCGKPRCQSQCPPPPPPPPPPPYAIGRCGMQAGGRKCPTGLCCSSSGWCGTTEYYCAKQWCQSQCNTITSSTMSGTETVLLDGVV